MRETHSCVDGKVSVHSDFLDAFSFLGDEHRQNDDFDKKKLH